MKLGPWRRLGAVITAAVFATGVAVALAQPAVAATADAPINVTSEPGDLRVTLHWAPPINNGGATVTDYVVRYRPQGSTAWSTAPRTASVDTSQTVSGITDGAPYEFGVAAVTSAGTGAYAASVVDTPAAPLFSDTFDSLTTGALNGQNGWKANAGNWTVTPASAGTTGQVVIGSGGGSFFNNEIYNSAAGTVTRLIYDADYLGDGDGSAYAMGILRKPDNALGGYVLNANGSGTYGIVYNNGGISGIGQGSATLNANTWYTYDVTAYNDSTGTPQVAYAIYPRGETRAQATYTGTFPDPGRTFGSATAMFGLAINGAGSVAYDNVRAYGVSSTAKSVAITSPERAVTGAASQATRTILDEGGISFTIPYIQTSPNLTVSGIASSSDLLANGRRLRFTLSHSGSTVATQYATTSPASVTFSGLAKGTYDLALADVDANNNPVTGVRADSDTGMAIGDIVTAMGDSITMGYAGNNCPMTASATWVAARAAGCATSADGRNFGQYAVPGDHSGPYFNGWLVPLANRLAALRGYPVFIMNEGWGGITSGGYVDYMKSANNYANVAFIGPTYWPIREALLQPTQFLINLGVNDTGLGTGAANLRTNLGTIVGLLKSTYGGTNQNIQIDLPNYLNSNPSGELDYVAATKQAITDTGVQTGADYYTYFKSNQQYVVDSVHPSVAGMDQMARLHFLKDIAPTGVTATANADGTISVSWSSLSATEPTISGYNVKYGTASGSYATTKDAGSATSYKINGLTPGTKYYVAVAGYSPVNPASTTDVSETANSVETSASVTSSSPTTTTVDDATLGTGPLAVSYSGNWAHCTSGCNSGFGATFNAGTVSYDAAVGDYFTIAFTGRQIQLYGLVASGGGTSGVSIDGGPETTATWFANSSTVASVYSSPTLSSGAHTIKVRVSGNGAGGGPWVNLDKAVVTS